MIAQRCEGMYCLLQLLESNDLDALVDLQRRSETRREHDRARAKPFYVSIGLFLQLTRRHLAATVQHTVSWGVIKSATLEASRHLRRHAAMGAAQGCLTSHRNSSPLATAPHTHLPPISVVRLRVRSQVCLQPDLSWLSAARRAPLAS